MGELIALGYVGVTSDKLDEWRSFATGLLGMQVSDVGRGGLELRMDDQRQRFFVTPGSGEGCRLYGWEVLDAAALDRLGATLEAAGVPVTREPQSLAARRGVKELLAFQDPLGNRLEAFHGQQSAATPFVPGRNISGFRTGALGLGHAVLTTRDIGKVMPFYRDVLGFRLSDYTLRPFKAYFFHINARHHSLAMVETGVDGVHHIMVELFSFDDVGQGYDIALTEAERVRVTLGRHTNDLMTSFYVATPSGFMMEYGWGGRNIDPATWQTFECDYGPSLWGHERSWLTAENRAEAKSLRLAAAQQGYREPVQVLAGNYHLMAPGVDPAF